MRTLPSAIARPRKKSSHACPIRRRLLPARAMLTRLEAKGHVRHREEGLRYLYMPTKWRASDW
jgi:hypothetical protein